MPKEKCRSDTNRVHHNFEVDRSLKNNAKHERVIRQNDPDAIYEKEILDY